MPIVLKQEGEPQLRGSPSLNAVSHYASPRGESPPGMPKRYGAKRSVQPRTVFRTLTQYVTFFGFEE